MKRWAAIVALVPFSALLVVSIWLLTRPDPGPASFASPMRPVPETEMQLLDGGSLKLPDLKGRPYIVNIWASWCAPCRIEHPVLVQMAGQGVEIIGVLYGDPDPTKARKILADEGNPFRQIVIDPTRDFGLEVGISGVPESFLVNSDGIIVKTLRAPIADAKTAQTFIDAWKAEGGKPPGAAAQATEQAPAAP
ncbi:MAG TPA: redoxin family protein [Hyphomonadaceae bacterium]|jgi:cytochrome c biogenesis protein CcmG/thiol:disulfide interchange protein DsbE|nr:redoxin family protein [Hyphomonadaceae bacterium]